jgi:hypothetical protein
MTDYIHFTENNLDVYSVKLANFILRANVECESLLKELYKRTEHFEGLSKREQNIALENNTYTQVNAEYKLDNKTIYIASEIFYFQGRYSELFTPFKYEKNGKDSHKIYNSIKHDKVNNLKKADLETAINMLGTLFVLNLCFYPELIEKAQDERSKIFRGRKAYIEPLFLSGISEIDNLDKDEVEEYFESCCYYEWVPELIEPREYALREINFMLENHKDEINRTLDDLITTKGEIGKVFEARNYPLLLSVPVTYLKTTENISVLHNGAKKFYECLKEEKETK